MAETPEAKVKKKVKALLEEHKAWFNMPVPTGYGIPMLDFVGCHRGRFFSVETKAPGAKLTPRQEFTKAEMEAAGGAVFIVGEHILVVKNPSGTYNFDTYSGMVELEAWLLLHS